MLRTLSARSARTISMPPGTSNNWVMEVTSLPLLCRSMEWS